MRLLTLCALIAGLGGCGGARPEPTAATGPGPAPDQRDQKPDPWRDCYAGVAYVGNPRTDIARLTKSCGPVGGLRPITDVVLGAQSEAEPASRYTFHVPKAGTCYRVFAAGDSGIRDLDIALRGPDGADLVADLSRDAQPVVPTSGPLCFEIPGLYMLEVSVVSGSGRYAVQVWGGQVQ